MNSGSETGDSASIINLLVLVNKPLYERNVDFLLCSSEDTSRDWYGKLEVDISHLSPLPSDEAIETARRSIEYGYLTLRTVDIERSVRVTLAFF